MPQDLNHKKWCKLSHLKINGTNANNEQDSSPSRGKDLHTFLRPMAENLCLQLLHSSWSSSCCHLTWNTQTCQHISHCFKINNSTHGMLSSTKLRLTTILTHLLLTLPNLFQLNLQWLGEPYKISLDSLRGIKVMLERWYSSPQLHHLSLQTSLQIQNNNTGIQLHNAWNPQLFRKSAR